MNIYIWSNVKWREYNEMNIGIYTEESFFFGPKTINKYM